MVGRKFSNINDRSQEEERKAPNWKEKQTNNTTITEK